MKPFICLSQFAHVVCIVSGVTVCAYTLLHYNDCMAFYICWTFCVILLFVLKFFWSIFAFYDDLCNFKMRLHFLLLSDSVFLLEVTSDLLACFFLPVSLLSCHFCVQHGESAVKTHHLEYCEGGILDMDDLLTDLVEDRDKVRMIWVWYIFAFGSSRLTQISPIPALKFDKLTSDRQFLVVGQLSRTTLFLDCFYLVWGTVNYSRESIILSCI